MPREIQISAAERCYRSISRMIVSLELKPNAPIGEQMLAEMLGVSRTPVREALARLSTERLVDLRSRSGVIVSPIRYEAFHNAQFVREKLEMAIIAEAAGGTDRRLLLSIRQAIEEQELAVAEGNPELFFASDERMHYHFCCLAGRAGVWNFISDAKKHMDRARRLSIQNGQLDTLLNDHHLIFAAVEKGDATKAQTVMQQHLRRIIEDLREFNKTFPDYFEQSYRTGDMHENGA